MRFLKSLTYASVGAGLAGICGVVLYSPDEVKRQLTSNGLVRVGRAARVVVLISYDYKKSLWGVDPNSVEYSQVKSQVHLRSALRLRDLCCVNGGAYIKVGQYVGSLDYLLPPEYVQTMKVLHSNAPQSPLCDIKHVIEEELNGKVEKMFAHFEDKPIGAASLAQVHKATLHDGRVVAVKVQHRDVQKHAAVDIKTLEILADAVSWLFPDFKFKWLVDESKKHLPLELDFELEGQNAEKMMHFFEKYPFVKIPEIYWEYSTKRVLTMEFCEGGKVDDLPYMQSFKISSDETLSSDFRVQYCKMWQALIRSDIDGVKQSSEALGVGEMYGLLACILTARSWDVVTTGIDQGPVTDHEAELIRESAATYVTQINELLNRVPRQLLLLLKTNDLLRSIDYSLKTSATSCSFITMSRCCIRAVTKQRLQHCRSWRDWFLIQADSTFSHFRITLYQVYVSSVVTSLRSLISRIMNGLHFL
ncbi:aarF domain-containing protein kinase 1-like isoform X2 [Porites lutea]|uniref:aarF domain-containing protein kinase 1-like isoform X2 n=1 Tax=Porites lutea TaxID=51062 RepID=UPI003CC5CBCD